MRDLRDTATQRRMAGAIADGVNAWSGHEPELPEPEVELANSMGRRALEVDDDTVRAQVRAVLQKPPAEAAAILSDPGDEPDTTIAFVERVVMFLLDDPAVLGGQLPGWGRSVARWLLRRLFDLLD